MKIELLNIFSKFQRDLKKFKVVVMPDFFVDTILSGSYNYNFDKFKEKINSGGFLRLRSKKAILSFHCGYICLVILQR